MSGAQPDVAGHRDRAGFDFDAWLAATCQSSGVPTRVEDIAALAKIASLLRGNAGPRSP